MGPKPEPESLSDLDAIYTQALPVLKQECKEDAFLIQHTADALYQNNIPRTHSEAMFLSSKHLPHSFTPSLP